MDFAITINSNSPVPLHQQLYEELRQAILNGRLLPGGRIPSTRQLAKSLGISRTTVTQTYDQLLSEGYLETVVGSGTFVCSQLPDDLLRSAPVQSTRTTTRPPVQLSKYGVSLAQTENVPRVPEPELLINFRYGRPAFDQFPIELWRKQLSRYCCSNLEWLDYSTDILGYKPLREAIARYLSRSRAVNCDPDQVLVVNGTQQALDLIMRLFIEPGKIIALEDPGYLSARLIFETQGAKLLPITVDESGLVVEDLANHAKEQVRLVYVTPSHQFPTGAILSLPRRLELLTWSGATGAFIIEDDYDSEYRYGDRPIPALQGLDKSDSVLYIGTFSKVLFPSLRIGYLVLPKSLVSVFARAKWLSDRHLQLLEQQVLADFIEEGHLERHIRKMRAVYDKRRQVLVKAFNMNFAEKATILGEKAGIHLMVRLQTPFSDEEIMQRAERAGVGIMSAAPHYLRAYSKGEFIFGYGELTEQQLVEGIDRLAQSLNNNSY
ncbi:aspartate aminotransferase [Scytonema hofmannii PCC 7110]|uniref:Aspartate aminotransferase n=1 Tax=Scytonema hofmannii PCC 7110 TaxID=128403 RepID=A0A139X623_9CYAN|nr:PLP-dependent aminotransferase family protein [Scytonema hofmannii]KYC40161.1 aspartate aminotransferase [Scytonema hofmannii PCC 7110]